MPKLILHPKTKTTFEAITKQPPNAVLVIGPSGIGKKALARTLASRVLKAPDLAKASYFLGLSPDNNSISIDQIRRLEHFLMLKVLGKSDINRVVMIEDAQVLSTEAQNALLKTLEEPPIGTIIILTTTSEHHLLPTIVSRAQSLKLVRPSRQQLRDGFKEVSDERFNQAYTLSSGLPGLLTAIVSDDDHPLLAATELARQLLTKPVYERLLLVDQLAKDKPLVLNTVGILQQMAELSLNSAKDRAAKQWQRVLKASYQANEAIEANAQLKLVLTNLMLNL